MSLLNVSYKWHFLNLAAQAIDQGISSDHYFSFKAHTLSIPIFCWSCLLNNSHFRFPSLLPWAPVQFMTLPICHYRSLSDCPTYSLTSLSFTKAAEVTFLVWKSDPCLYSWKFFCGFWLRSDKIWSFAWQSLPWLGPCPTSTPTCLAPSTPLLS